MLKSLQISSMQVTTTSYGFSLGRQICLGFVQDFSGEGGQPVHIGWITSLCFIPLSTVHMLDDLSLLLTFQVKTLWSRVILRLKSLEHAIQHNVVWILLFCPRRCTSVNYTHWFLHLITLQALASPIALVLKVMLEGPGDYQATRH